MEVQPRQIKQYITEDGKVPFAEWLDSFQDRKTRLKIKLRLDRVEQGNLGDFKVVGEGVFELRIDYGGGYRIYFGQVGLTIILLLCGGDKSSQKKDIKLAQKYWRNYGTRQNTN